MEGTMVEFSHWGYFRNLKFPSKLGRIKMEIN
jgi:hypothetical protein